MKIVVLGFSGRIGSGKTTISNSVSEALNCPRVGFGDYVRKVTRRLGLEATRQNWQTVGEALLNKGTDRFCRRVLEQEAWHIGQSLVIDGIRHSEVAVALKQLVSPSKFYLIHLFIEETEREIRLRQRSTSGKLISYKMEHHSTEVQVKTSLAQMADLTINAAKPIEEIVYEVLAWIKSLDDC